MSEKVSSFAEARMRLVRAQATKVIDLEPLAVIEPKGKSVR